MSGPASPQGETEARLRDLVAAVAARQDRAAFAELFGHFAPRLKSFMIRGGADPVKWIGDYGKRISAVHVKDIAPAGENADEDGWADVGYGTVDWKGLFAALRATPVRHFIIEHDKPSDPERFAARSIAAAATY